MSPDARELFVVGSPRSGTTLLASVLNQLPEVWIGEETGFVPHLYRPGFESLHEFDDQQLAALVEAVNSYLTMGHWTRLASVAGARQFWSESGTTGYSGFVRYVWSLDGALEARGALVVGDQTPTYVLAMPLLEQLFPNAHYVHIVRDPRDVVASILPLRFGAKSAAVAASDWNECISGWWAAEHRIPAERRFEVRYEDLVTTPTVIIERLAEFLDTTPPGTRAAGAYPADANRLARLAPHHRRLASPIDDRSVGRHRRDLSVRDRDLVEAIAYAGMVTYGYQAGPFRASPVLAEDTTLLTRARLEDLRRRAFGSVVRRWQR